MHDESFFGAALLIHSRWPYTSTTILLGLSLLKKKSIWSIDSTT